MKTSLKTISALLFVACLSLLMSCSTGLGNDLHPNQGPGTYKQTYDIRVSAPCHLKFRFETTRHDHVVFNGERHSVREMLTIPFEGHDRFSIVSAGSETGLRVTFEIVPVASRPETVRVDVLGYGYLNGNRIYTHEDHATIRSSEKRGNVMGLGEFR